MAILRRLGANGNAQQIYELCFILWALSLVITSPSRNGEEVELKTFLSSGAVQVLAELLVSSPTKKVFCFWSLFYLFWKEVLSEFSNLWMIVVEKVSRMVISALKNLSATENDAVLSEMLAAGDDFISYFFLHFFISMLMLVYIHIFTFKWKFY